MAAAAAAPSADPCSYSNVTELQTTHLHMELLMNFEKKTLAGTVAISLAAVAGAACTTCTLDTRDLEISKVVSVGGDGAETTLEFKFGEKSAALGTQLVITLPAGGAARCVAAARKGPTARHRRTMERPSVGGWGGEAVCTNLVRAL